MTLQVTDEVDGRDRMQVTKSAPATVATSGGMDTEG